MPSSSSLDKRFSDIVGSLNYKNKDIFNFNYNYIRSNFKETITMKLTRAIIFPIFN